MADLRPPPAGNQNAKVVEGWHEQVCVEEEFGDNKLA